jgi:hypothetical protein
MTNLNIQIGQASLTSHGKKMVAHAMFHKGKHFLGAAILLEKRDGYRDVVLHLICQGIEIIQKGMLLAQDFDKYAPKLQKPLGHNLVRGSELLRDAFKLKPLKKATQEELCLLSEYYCKHLLRYGSIHDVIGGGGHNLEFQRVVRRAMALMIFGEKLFK